MLPHWKVRAILLTLLLAATLLFLNACGDGSMPSGTSTPPSKTPAAPPSESPEESANTAEETVERFFQAIEDQDQQEMLQVIDSSLLGTAFFASNLGLVPSLLGQALGIQVDVQVQGAVKFDNLVLASQELTPGLVNVHYSVDADVLGSVKHGEGDFLVANLNGRWRVTADDSPNITGLLQQAGYISDAVFDTIFDFAVGEEAIYVVGWGNPGGSNGDLGIFSRDGRLLEMIPVGGGHPCGDDAVFRDDVPSYAAPSGGAFFGRYYGNVCIKTKTGIVSLYRSPGVLGGREDSIIASAYVSGTPYVTADTGVDVYDQPSLSDGKVVGQLSAGSKYPYNGESGAWINITFGTVSAWVRSELVRKGEDNPEPAEDEKMTDEIKDVAATSERIFVKMQGLAQYPQTIDMFDASTGQHLQRFATDVGVQGVLSDMHPGEIRVDESGNLFQRALSSDAWSPDPTGVFVQRNFACSGAPGCLDTVYDLSATVPSPRDWTVANGNIVVTVENGENDTTLRAYDTETKQFTVTGHCSCEVRFPHSPAYRDGFVYFVGDGTYGGPAPQIYRMSLSSGQVEPVLKRLRRA
jgi:hypothetical protein